MRCFTAIRNLTQSYNAHDGRGPAVFRREKRTAVLKASFSARKFFKKTFRLFRSTLQRSTHGRRYSSTCGVPFPLETKPVTNLAERASLKIATAHSLVIRGSLYALTMTLLPWRVASRTRSSGVTRIGPATAAGSRRACDVTQFWQ